MWLYVVHVCACLYTSMQSLTVVKLHEKQSRLLSVIEGLEAARQERNEEIATLKVRAAHLQGSNRACTSCTPACITLTDNVQRDR